MKHAVNTATVLPLLALLLATAGCGSSDKNFELRLVSRDVRAGAVDRVEIVFDPGELDQKFMKVDDQDYFKGSVTTRVSNAGQFVVNLDNTYIDAHLNESANPSSDGFEFDIAVPLHLTGSASSGIADPLVTVEFLQAGDRIARGGQTVAWPLKGSGVDIVVACVDMDDNIAKCMTGKP